MKWRWKKWLERRRARRELRAEKKQVSEDGTREKTSKSHALKGETPEVPEQRTEAKPVADAEGEPAPSTGVQDHVLLVIDAMVQGTCVSVLIDSGASRSFINDQLQCRPALHFVGAYSALELANGETIVSTGIAPRVLVCIGSIPCRLSLTAVPMMERIQLILGKDWLDIMNPLVDWGSNTMFLRNGSQLEPIKGISVPSGTQCQIIDKGLPGLQQHFGVFRQGSDTPTMDWRDKIGQLYSPKFWQYNTSAKAWAIQQQSVLHQHPSPGTSDVP